MRDDQKLRVRYNSGGHPREFTINLPGYSHDRYIPDGVAYRMQALLGSGYAVSNRGSRLEVNSQLFTGDGDPHVAVVVAALVGSLDGLYDQTPEVDVVLRPYVAPVVPTRDCPRGCGKFTGTAREVLEHMRAVHR